MTLRYFQRGFNYSQDGPGNRLVYHLKGCNMCCPWCSNPEGMNIEGEATEHTADEIVSEITSCAPMFFDGGGVTFTGGEATLQAKAVTDIIRRLKVAGIHTAIETNASCDIPDELIELCDFWITDFKHHDAQRLKEITAGRLDTVKANIKKITQKKPIHIRIPLIHGFNDDDAALCGFTEFFTELKKSNAEFDIEILPYHEYGREKWEKCGKKYTVTNGFVNEETLKKFTKTFLDNKFKVIKT